jgi:hypothetical protein
MEFEFAVASFSFRFFHWFIVIDCLYFPSLFKILFVSCCCVENQEISIFAIYNLISCEIHTQTHIDINFHFFFARLSLYKSHANYAVSCFSLCLQFISAPAIWSYSQKPRFFINELRVAHLIFQATNSRDSRYNNIYNNKRE